ncbi:lipoprotein signal peptidase [Agrobacterium tumefaciens]|jgi:signal peptidase II|uniref:Lipoprotein signal peptidase n=1 Tax=Agrobacterium fabrum (strain C58 / ATCC 33970) TaxID=176299 RepID=A9CKD5_AGRFC|nr:signal peptidase II [Agrobacterium fabrum]KEY54757.1 lipoprotein signal peptidase [Agrobacterium tumefaciens]AAK86158.1 lipoprotein signal peptidase [Agrobacterium fabrum str. C58]KJX89507.1 lipoprotein signal peptidase [Agrobacterium tumefaciens]MCX2874562.1 signal peptidase II [Agrobacterium fabrum]NMV68970.1 signal peptidase II [Agrobacterium fabrum]
MAKAALFSKFAPAFTLIAAALVLDQIVKQLVEAYLPLQEMVPVAPFLALYRTYNLGVAFSMLEDMHGWFIVSMRLVIVVFVLWLWRKTAADRTFAHLGFAFIIAGAAGNLLDRFFYGHVIDYILFHTQTWSFAVFNLADSFITIGAACVILDEFLHARAAKK